MRLPVLVALFLMMPACGSQPDNANSDQGVTVDLPGAETGNDANMVASAEPLLNDADSAAAPPEPAPAAKPEPAKAEPAGQPEESQVADASADDAQPPAPAAAADATPAQLPISNVQAARTIDRIGFSCGEVVSTERVLTDGGAVFRINCSSGQSYRGTTQRGRFRFRRWTDG